MECHELFANCSHKLCFFAIGVFFSQSMPLPLSIAHETTNMAHMNCNYGWRFQRIYVYPTLAKKKKKTI